MNPTDRLLSLWQENNAAQEAQAAQRERFRALGARHNEGKAPRGVSAFQLFQTPPAVAADLAALLALKPGARVLEPSAGLGRLLDAVAPYKPAEVVAVEQAAPLAAELYRQARPGVVLKQRDFMTLTPAELGAFDAVIMNPPFHLRADVRHIEHAMRFLKPGGVLAALCMDTHHRRDAFQTVASTWRELPAGTFRASGTNVATIMFSVRG